MNNIDLTILDIQPSQFHISQEKLVKIGQWFDPCDLSNFEPLPIKELNGRIIYTDGHTRAFAAWKAGLIRVPLVWDEDDLDWEMYQLCVNACLERKITSIADLDKRTLSAEEYHQKWNRWCDEMQEAVSLQRKAKDAP